MYITYLISAINFVNKAEIIVGQLTTYRQPSLDRMVVVEGERLLFWQQLQI